MGDAVVVIGVGNPDRGDDAAGRRVAAALRGAVPGGVVVMESDGDPAAIMDAWSGADLAVVVDAMVSGSVAGTVRRFDATATPLPHSVNLASTHGMGAAEAIELARSLERLPLRLLVYGIEGTDFHPGHEMSPAVADAVEVARGMVLAEVCDA
ncbi:MAG: hydrogenase maturation protease [Actinobacteria bacterium]|nr:hydrogenase maturation protease [Actinomycetota bacterium]MBU1493450.1 hydrogenase maturation protease [Actinomycetota bacterium]MBU1865079.1 hydrogenase maturation protease [Actinomycetota bacterium]